MARTPIWETIPMATGGKAPTWPLPGVAPKFATWSLGGGRPFGCALASCQRWHAGVDLTQVPEGSVMVAPEDGVIAGVDKGWTDGTRAMFLRTDTGLFLVLGGMIAGSHKPFGIAAGQRVRQGDKLGRIVGAYGMLHLEAYVAEPSRTANSRWWKDDPVPPGLLNPIHYIERMTGQAASLLQARERLQALKDLGHDPGDIDGPWGPAAIAALTKAQSALGIAADGIWGPATEEAIVAALAARSPCGSLEDCAGVSANPHARRPTLRIVGAVIAGVAVASLAAAVFLRTSRARKDDDDGV
jgi:hypothetical protein